MKQAAGTMLFRAEGDSIQVLLVHPSGNYNRNAPWSIPKGELDEGEDPETAARRETLEETGIKAGALFSLDYVEYRKSRKQVHGFAGPAPTGVQPCCASWEIDRAEFLPIDKARVVIHPDQLPFIDRLLARLQE